MPSLYDQYLESHLTHPTPFILSVRCVGTEASSSHSFTAHVLTPKPEANPPAHCN